jgi:hypothetical protein
MNRPPPRHSTQPPPPRHSTRQPSPTPQTPDPAKTVYDTEKLSERIAKLSGGVAVIKVGGVWSTAACEGLGGLGWQRERTRACPHRIGATGAPNHPANPTAKPLPDPAPQQKPNRPQPQNPKTPKPQNPTPNPPTP